MEPTQNTNSFAVPIAIITGFTLIALAILLRPQDSNPSITPTTDLVATDNTSNSIRPITAEDYRLGNPNASIVMIEYSDYDCAFCKQHHATMHQILDEFGVTGRLAWVYRQFPLVDFHPNSALLSEAALCVGDIGGNSAFWDFSDAVFASRTGSEPTNITRLPEFVTKAGVDLLAYQDCLDSDRTLERLKSDLEDGLAAGAGVGTPYTVIHVGKQTAVISGAQPYYTIKEIIQNLLDQLDGATAVKETIPTPADSEVQPVSTPANNNN